MQTEALAVIGRTFFLDEPIRVYGTAEQPLFMAVEVCDILGLARTPANALKAHPENEKLRYVVRTSGQAREAWFVNEPGLYRLIFKSRKPEAEKFKTWVFNEVLPCIRKYGQFRTVGKIEAPENEASPK